MSNESTTVATAASAGAAALISLGASILGTIIESLIKQTGMTRDQAIAALTSDLAATLSDKDAAEKADVAIIEGSK